ncbi:hypothetical protein PR048_019220 [Dryococelus australis]|uniref:Uncharacterized protein n=1 Tax=Dryococelus australis TaxID=614101 RepID=A0ABQ9H304_9NEOP|nr:hypothetical protein PR048_019220 [Dryococelus australis]
MRVGETIPRSSALTIPFSRTAATTAGLTTTNSAASHPQPGGKAISKILVDGMLATQQQMGKIVRQLNIQLRIRDIEMATAAFVTIDDIREEGILYVPWLTEEGTMVYYAAYRIHFKK